MGTQVPIQIWLWWPGILILIWHRGRPAFLVGGQRGISEELSKIDITFVRVLPLPRNYQEMTAFFALLMLFMVLLVLAEGTNRRACVYVCTQDQSNCQLRASNLASCHCTRCMASLTLLCPITEETWHTARKLALQSFIWCRYTVLPAVGTSSARTCSY